MNPVVDLNGDLGESFGVYRLADDAWLMSVVTSVNIACGFHAGDPLVMRHTVKLAAERGLCIGAHPGLPDLQGFGRRDMAVTPDEVYGMVAYQLGALMAIARCEGAQVHHVKPHGALYNMASRDLAIASAIHEAVMAVDPSLAIFVLAGTEWAAVAKGSGLRVVEEGFADRRYLPDGRLVPRHHPNAKIQTHVEAAEQAVRMVLDGKVVAQGGTLVDLHVDTLCIHGDSPEAANLAERVRAELEQAGVTIVSHHQPG